MTFAQRATFFFQSIFARISHLIPWENFLATSAAIAMEAANVNETPPIKARREWRQDFYFRESILDKLGQYFIHLKNMRRSDPDAYDLYSKIGAVILPESAGVDGVEVSPWFRKTLPGFGAVALAISTQAKADDKKEGLWRPRFVCFTKFDKYHRPKNVQANNSPGTFYKISMLWDDPTNDHRPMATQSAVVLTTDGRVLPLKVLLDKPIKIKHKRGKRRYTTLMQSEWGYPKAYIAAAKEHGVSVEEDLINRFVLAANLFEASLSGMITVTAKSPNGLLAKFNVEPTRTPYFFKDRDGTACTSGGRRKKIFHIVRQHMREGRGGGQSAIKTHFRGLRSFIWNGYEVSISVPGRDHMSIGDFTVPAYDADSEMQGRTISAKELGEFLTGETIH